jgi:4a-hydroxytetrahydrobiopterin dehydratase
MAKLEASELRVALRGVPLWRRRRQELHRTYVLPDFEGAIRLVNRVAKLAERANHHPDILVKWNRVTLTLTTHDAGGLTAKDFDLAQACDRAAERLGAS